MQILDFSSDPKRVLHASQDTSWPQIEFQAQASLATRLSMTQMVRLSARSVDPPSSQRMPAICLHRDVVHSNIPTSVAVHVGSLSPKIKALWVITSATTSMYASGTSQESLKGRSGWHPRILATRRQKSLRSMSVSSNRSESHNGTQPLTHSATGSCRAHS